MSLKAVLSFLFVTILGLTLHAVTVRGLPGNLSDVTKLGGLTREASPFESSHERAPYAEMLSIMQNRTIQLSKPLADFGSPDIGINEQKQYFSFFPSGVSAALIPGYLLGSRVNLGQVGAYYTMGIFTTLAMLFIFLIAKDVFKVPLWAAIIAPITYAFGTTAWSYSVTIYQHAPAALFAMLMFYSVWRYKQKTRKQYLWAAIVWFTYGISLFFDYPNALLLLPFMVYFLIVSLSVSTVKRKKRVIRVSLNSVILRMFPIFIVLVVWHGWHNQHFLGNWKQIGNNLPRYTIKSAEQLRLEKLDVKKQKEEADKKRMELAEKAAGGITKALSEDKVPLNAQILLTGVDKGLFLFSPVLIMAFLGIITLRRREVMEKSVMLAFIVANIVIYSSFADPYGGWAFGPRYLVPAMAGLSLFVAIGISTGRLQIVRKIVFTLLFMVSSAIAIAGAITTNLIPPKVEADFLKIPYYNFLHNFDLLKQNVATSYVFNTFFARQMSLLDFAEIIWMTLSTIVIVTVFILPLFVHDEVTKKTK